MISYGWLTATLLLQAFMIVGIDASRNRSGGAIANLIGIVSEGDPIALGIEQVHVWTYKKLSNRLPERPWLVKHCPHDLEKSLLSQVWWQSNNLPKVARKARCDILYSTDAATVCRFRPMVVMSQDMLSYEPGVMTNFGYTKARLRLLAILLVQNLAFRRSQGVIFLTHYASRVIQRSCGRLRHIAHIPHGVGESFKHTRAVKDWPKGIDRPVRCVYVSNAEMHKHQWVVVRAIAELRNRGYNVNLRLVGGGRGRGQELVEKEMRSYDPKGEFITQEGFVPQERLPGILTKANLFIFASSCENMPVTLLEGMAVGLPIACSNRGPMPETLKDGGVYFDPENSRSIAAAVEKLITDPVRSEHVAKRAKELSLQYSWARCADDTFRFLFETYKRYKAC